MRCGFLISARFIFHTFGHCHGSFKNLPEIKNPHRIYPGDVVVLDNSSGSPQLSLLHETVTLQPGAVEEPLEKEAIQTIAPNVIGPFLSQPLLIENGQLDTAPRIIAGPDNRVILSAGTRVYVNSIKEGDGLHWNDIASGRCAKTGDVYITQINRFRA